MNMYDTRKKKITVSEDAVLTGWRFPKTTLWRVPLKPMVTNLATDTLLFDGPNRRHSKHLSYHINYTPVNNHIHYLVQTLRTKHPHPQESVNIMYEIPNITPKIRYLHGASVSPVKSTWLAAIREPNNAYVTWPLINIKNVTNHFPESEETQLRHMKNQRHNVQSTKNRVLAPLAPQQDQGTSPFVTPTSPKNNVMYLRVYETRDTVYTDQTGKSPHTSIRGKKYQKILHNFDSNKTERRHNVVWHDAPISPPGRSPTK